MCFLSVLLVYHLLTGCPTPQLFICMYINKYLFIYFFIGMFPITRPTANPSQVVRNIKVSLCNIPLERFRTRKLRESLAVFWSRRVWQLQMGGPRFEIGLTCWITLGNSLHHSVSSFGKWGISFDYLDLWIFLSPLVDFSQSSVRLWDMGHMDPTVKTTTTTTTNPRIGRGILKRKWDQGHLGGSVD